MQESWQEKSSRLKRSSGAENPLDEWYWRLNDCQDSGERARLLEEVRRHDSAMAVELERMLDASRELGSFMEVKDVPLQTPFFRDARPTVPGNDDAAALSSCRIPKQIGPYKLLEPIGEGGMGIVYLAAQERPVRRKVAIKIIKPGMDSRQVIARFEAERQALALMEHPNIAKVLDAGTTEGGLPYFVMELVRGIPITRYCDRARMGTQDRLELFQAACAALQHAHNKGIIHRDVKPSNVLVTEHDGTPVVKVIDFGVAKALTENLTDTTLYTGMFQMIGTPLYMSPEQASLSNLDVDTRSDVYSLGVLLYVLISGALPIDRDAFNTMSMEELRNYICNTEPLRPSKRLGTLKESQETIAECRGVSFSQLQKAINSELEWIIMRAIEKDRQRRYQSPRALSDDIARYLQGEAVEACPPSWTYRTRKFTKKHRTFLAVASVIMLALTTATAVSVSQAVRATRASIKATLASAEAARNLDVAKQQTRILSEFLYAEDIVAAGKEHLAGNYESFDRILARHRASKTAHDRGFEWQLINSLQPVATNLLFQAEDRLNDFVFSLDGKRLYLGDSADNLICVDATSGEMLDAVQPGQEVVHDLAMLDDGRLISVGEAGTIRVFKWDDSERFLLEKRIAVGNESLLSVTVSSTENLAWTGTYSGRTYEVDLTSGQSTVLYERPGRQVHDLELTPAGKLVVAQHSELLGLDRRFEDQQPAARLDWSYAPNRGMGKCRDIESTPDGELIAFAQIEGLVTLFRNAGPRPEIEFSHLFPNSLFSVAISPDGSWLAAGDNWGKIHLMPTQIYDADGFLDQSNSRSRRLRSWKAHDGKIEKLMFTGTESDGSLRVLSAGRDQRLVVSDPLSSRLSKFTSIAELGNRFATPDNRSRGLLAHKASNVPLMHPAFSTEAGHQNHVNDWISFADLPELESVAALIDRRQLLIIPKTMAEPAREIWRARPGTEAVNFDLASDGGRLAICAQRSSPRSHAIEIYDVGKATPLHSTPCDLARDIMFSPDGRTLAYVWNNDVVLMDPDSGRQLHLLQLHRDSIQCLEFSPDGKQIASVSVDRRLAVWDVASGELLWSQIAHQNRASGVAFHPTMPTIATVGADATVRLWSNREKVADDSVRLVGEFPLEVGRCADLDFSADGKALFVRHVGRGVTELRASQTQSETKP